MDKEKFSKTSLISLHKYVNANLVYFSGSTAIESWGTFRKTVLF